jgi:hypothetical protein
VKKYHCRQTIFAFGGQLHAASIDRRLRKIAFYFAIVFLSVEPISGIDQNGDGMSDVWQKKYSVPSTDANFYYTGTGLTNRQKSLLGLDPRDPNARFHLEITSDASNTKRPTLILSQQALLLVPCFCLCFSEVQIRLVVGMLGALSSI